MNQKFVGNRLQELIMELRQLKAAIIIRTLENIIPWLFHLCTFCAPWPFFQITQDGVIDVHYIKRTHRQKDFNAVKAGELPIRLTKNIGKVTYVLYWVLENEEAHARVSKLGVEKFYKRWNRCLTTMPKIILGENVI